MAVSYFLAIVVRTNLWCTEIITFSGMGEGVFYNANAEISLTKLNGCIIFSQISQSFFLLFMLHGFYSFDWNPQLSPLIFSYVTWY